MVNDTSKTDIHGLGFSAFWMRNSSPTKKNRLRFSSAMIDQRISTFVTTHGAAILLLCWGATLERGSIAAEQKSGRDVSPGEEIPVLESLSPREVVLFQMDNLADWRTTTAAAERVFSRASPSNKAVTGPLDRFRKMVESPPYDALIDNRGWTAGQAIERNDVAAVLVSVMYRSDQLRIFRFYLSKVKQPSGGEWMTDAVIEVTPPKTEIPDNHTS